MANYSHESRSQIHLLKISLNLGGGQAMPTQRPKKSSIYRAASLLPCILLIFNNWRVCPLNKWSSGVWIAATTSFKCLAYSLLPLPPLLLSRPVACQGVHSLCDKEVVADCALQRGSLCHNESTMQGLWSSILLHTSLRRLWAFVTQWTGRPNLIVCGMSDITYDVLADMILL